MNGTFTFVCKEEGDEILEPEVEGRSCIADRQNEGPTAAVTGNQACPISESAQTTRGGSSFFGERLVRLSGNTGRI